MLEDHCLREFADYGDGWSLAVENEKDQPGRILLSFPGGIFGFRPFPILAVSQKQETLGNLLTYHHNYLGPVYGTGLDTVAQLTFMRDVPDPKTSSEPPSHYLQIQTPEGSTLQVMGYPEALESDLVALCEQVRTGK